MIEITDLTYKGILSGITLKIPDTKIVGIVGPNGSGKTTLLRCIFGAVKTQPGSVRLDGIDIARYRPHQLAQKIAVVSQSSDNVAPMSAAELVRLGRLAHRENSDTTHEIVARALAQVEMLELATSPLSQLSGGERQRVMIARAIAQQPTHILLDEPSNHLDIYHQLELFHFLQQYPGNSTVVLHDLNAAREFCDVVYLVHAGKIVASGAPAEVLTPEHLEPIYHVDVDPRSDHLHFAKSRK